MTKSSNLVALEQPTDEITIGNYSLTSTQLVIRGTPSPEDHVGAGKFIEWAAKGSGFWRADWLLHLRNREDWNEDVREQILADVGIDYSTLKNDWRVARIDPEVRRADVDFTHHKVVAAMPAKDQKRWLAEAADEHLSKEKLSKRIKAFKRANVPIRRGICDKGRLPYRDRASGRLRALVC